MGARIAPPYANLFMGKLEQEFLRIQDKIPQVWSRYIDDIFALWDQGQGVIQRGGVHWDLPPPPEKVSPPPVKKFPHLVQYATVCCTTPGHIITSLKS